MHYDAHNFSKGVEKILEKVLKDRTIPEENREAISRFKDFCVSEGLSMGRIYRYMYELRRASGMLNKKFEDADQEDIRRIVTEMMNIKKYSDWTKRDFKVSLRKFYRWLKGNENPPEVSWFKVHVKRHSTKFPQDMLTEEEVKRLIDHANYTKFKTFIALIYESGCRIGEILALRINQVKFDEYGAQLYVDGKTGFRRVRIISSVPYLTEWLNKHPQKDNPNAFLWISKGQELWSYGAVFTMLQRVAKKAGITKKVNPQNFRHSRATYLANFLTEAQMKEYFGWVQGSDMASIYVHLSGRDVDNALLKVYGMENREEKKESIFKPKECPRCQQVNQATNRFCSRCGMPLDKESEAEVIRKGMERKEADETMDQLLEDQEFREVLLRKVEGLRNHN